LTTRYSLSAKVGTYFAEKRWSLGLRQRSFLFVCTCSYSGQLMLSSEYKNKQSQQLNRLIFYCIFPLDHSRYLLLFHLSIAFRKRLLVQLPGSILFREAQYFFLPTYRFELCPTASSYAGYDVLVACPAVPLIDRIKWELQKQMCKETSL
jgi:hypothetical protein